MKTRGDKGRDIFTDLKIAMEGCGKFRINKRIEHIRHDLTSKYGMKDDEIVSELFIRYRKEKWYPKFNEERAGWTHYITTRVYYSMMNILSEQQFIHKKGRVVGHTQQGLEEELAVENYTDNVSVEDEYIESEAYTELCEELGEVVVKGLVEGKTLKIISEENGMNYGALQKRYHRLKKKFRG